MRIEELLEITHHSLVQYRLPGTGELVPLLQIAPSKTDAGTAPGRRPELADVLSAVITRIRDQAGPSRSSPPTTATNAYGGRRAPVLFQRRFTSEIRAISDTSLRDLLNTAVAQHRPERPAGGQPLRYTPHDFRRIFITDAIISGLPPHIAQVIAGHRDITTTIGYKAVYPEEAIQAHLAFLARRRPCGRPRNTASPPMRNGSNSSASLLTAPHLDRRPGAQPGPLRG